MMQTKEAMKALAASRKAIEKLLDSIGNDDHFSMGILGGILADLKTAQNQLNQFTGAK